ncbi:MAG: hypothetical protein BroJett030_28150 [Alphaproteobacteria bacterium]|nr:MAG: hypothetical protein BroJett030_28150 [Alphaproteobacteria bacterium]
MPDGTIIEMRVWRLPNPTAERPHGLKYSLFFGRPGHRIIAYDNEAGKGDHRHYDDVESPYQFRSLEELIHDFKTDIAAFRRRDRHHH